MPRPNPSENRDEFIARFMADEQSRQRWPDEAQRFRVAVSEWEGRDVSKGAESGMYSLFISRPVANAEELIDWAKCQGFPTVLVPGQLHATIAFSREEVPWFDLPLDERPFLWVPPGGPRFIHQLGDDGAVVLRFRSPDLEERHAQLVAAGVPWAHEGYRPHVTITWRGEGVDLQHVEPYDGQLVFGPEQWSKVGDFEAMEKQRLDLGGIFRDPPIVIGEQGPGAIVPLSRKPVGTVRIILGGEHLEKRSKRQVAYGWASVVEVDGVPVEDRQQDIISEEGLIDAAHSLARNGFGAKVMHDGESVGLVVESAVVTREMQQVLGVDLGFVGWWVGIHYPVLETWARVESGELSGFSIGGSGRRVTF